MKYALLQVSWKQLTSAPFKSLPFPTGESFYPAVTFFHMLKGFNSASGGEAGLPASLRTSSVRILGPDYKHLIQRTGTARSVWWLGHPAIFLEPLVAAPKAGSIFLKASRCNWAPAVYLASYWLPEVPR